MSDMQNQILYLNNMHPNNKYKELINYASEYHIPIMDQLSMQFIKHLITIHDPKHILEIGTAIGYSAINMADVSKANMHTLEKDEKMAEIAKENIKKYNLQNRISVMKGDAIDLLKNWNLNDTFDFILIDAAKGKYKDFFLLSEKLLSRNGIIISDNVLFRGFVANPNQATIKRHKKLAEKIHNYNQWLMNLKQFNTTLLPIGDGIALTTRNNIDV